MKLQRGEIVQNKQTGGLYQILGGCIDTTNENDGREMILYKSTNQSLYHRFVREREEFIEKFQEPKIKSVETA